MASVLAIVSKAVFEKAAPDAELGQVLAMSYASANKALEVLRDGGGLFLVTVRPPDERLWLVAILEAPRFSDGAWRATNTTPLTDITSVLPVLELEAGVGVTFKTGALGMTLQAPRRLAEAGADRLRALAGGKSQRAATAKPVAPTATKPTAAAKAAAKPTQAATAVAKPAKPATGKLADLVRAIGVKGARCDAEDTLALDAYQWVRHAPEIAALGRVRHLQLFKAAGRDLEQALERPELAHITSLSLIRNRLLEPEATAIASSPHLGSIEALDLRYSSVSGKSLATMLAMRAPALRRIDLEGNKVGAVGARALATSALAQQLTDLNLMANGCGDAALAELLGSPAIRNLEKLVADGAGPASRAALLANPLATRLEAIGLDGAEVKALLARNKKAKRPWRAPPASAAPAPAPKANAPTTHDDRGAELVARLAASFDDATRAVYVDWLLERGDGRGELATLDAQWIAANGEDDKLNGKLHRTQARLKKEFAQRYRFKSAELGYAHGLLVEVTARAQFFIDNGAELFANEPIRSISLSQVTAKDLPKLAAVPGIQRTSWISIPPDRALVEKALALFPNASIDLQEPDDDELDEVLALPGCERIRGLSLPFPKRDEIARHAKNRALAKLARLDIDDYICSLVFPEYREESDAAAVLAFGWKLAWVSTRLVTAENLAKLRAKVADVVMRYE